MFKQNASIHLPSSEVPVVGTYDVVVCGGGPAGLIAAVAAARGGAKTLLIERYGFLGGMSTSALVTPISEFRHFGKQHIGGIPRSEEHTSELQSLMRNSYAVFCLKKKKTANAIEHL